MAHIYALLAAACTAGVLLVLFLPEPYLPLAARTLHRSLVQMGRDPPSPSHSQLSVIPRTLLKVPVSALARAVTNLLPESARESLKRKLLLARLHQNLAVSGFMHLRLAAALVTGSYFLLIGLMSGDPLFRWLTIVGAALGAFLPDQWLTMQVNRRRRAIQKELPATLSALAIATEAGLVLGGAVAEVGRTRTGVLAAELRWAAEQMSLGIPQAGALEEMAARCEVPELTQVMSTLVQSFEKGSRQVVATLRTQAADAWAARRRKAEELAQQASIKLFLPLLFMVFPALMIFLLGPAAMLVFRSFTQTSP